MKSSSIGGTLHHGAPRALHQPVKVCHDLWEVSDFGWMEVWKFMTL